MTTGPGQRAQSQSHRRSESLRRFGGYHPDYCPDDAQLTLQVRRALVMACPAFARTVGVTVHDGVVFLRGTVGSERLLQQMYKVTRAVPGIHWICNDVTAPRRPCISRVA